jgi:hypothetical protein
MEDNLDFLKVEYIINQWLVLTKILKDEYTRNHESDLTQI